MNRSQYRVARWLSVLITIGVFAGVCYWILRPAPLSSVEMQMLGTWRSVSTGSATTAPPFVHEYRRDRTVVRRDPGVAAPPSYWTWRVEDGVLIVEQQNSFFDRLVNNPLPDIGRLEVISLSPEELVLGPRDNPTVLVREAD